MKLMSKLKKKQICAALACGLLLSMGGQWGGLRPPGLLSLDILIETALLKGRKISTLRVMRIHKPGLLTMKESLQARTIP